MVLGITQMTVRPPKYVKINVLSTEAMQNVMHEIKSDEIYNKLNKISNANPNLNYYIIYKDILRSKNKHMPGKLVKFYKYKHTKSTWITQGLLKSIRYRNKLYKQLKLTNPNSPNYETISINLQTYNGILKTNIHAAKQIYFESCFNRFKNDIRNSWKTMNDFLSKTKTQNKFPTFFKENYEKITDKKDIANKLNIVFTNIAQTLQIILNMMAIKIIVII